MKLTIYLFIMLISAKECDNTKTQLGSETISEVTTIDWTENQMQNDKKITYQSVSRGFFLTITVDSDSISFSNDRDVNSVTTHKIPKEEKEELTNLMIAMNETMLPELEAPSKAHQYDGAAIATLEVVNGEDSYKTVSFDHGNPPESIKAIVEMMLSIKTMIEKQ